MVEEAHQSAKDILTERKDKLDEISKILLARETIDAKEFEALIEGASEEEVFGSGEEDEVEEDSSPEEPVAEGKPARDTPRPVPTPRPGFAGGGAEMRADDAPEPS